MGKSKFWIYDPNALFSRMEIFPTKDMSRVEKLNALTRLSFAGSAVLYVMEYKKWREVLGGSVILIVLMELMGKGEDEKEGFSVTPTYDSTDYHTTVIAPSLAEEWQVRPPAYDIFVDEGIKSNDVVDLDALQPMDMRQYPYGQYMTRSNLLPSTEYQTHQMKGSHRSAREFANNNFIRQKNVFQDNMMRTYRKRLDRRFRHTNNLFSPYSGY